MLKNTVVEGKENTCPAKHISKTETPTSMAHHGQLEHQKTREGGKKNLSTVESKPWSPKILSPNFRTCFIMRARLPFSASASYGCTCMYVYVYVYM